MKKRRKGVWMALPPGLALAVIAGSVGAGNVKAIAAPTEETEEAIYNMKIYCANFHGNDFRIVNWWEGEPKEPTSLYEGYLLDHMEELEEFFRCKLHVENIGVSGEAYLEKLSASILAGEPLGHVCALDASWVPTFVNNEWMVPLDTLITSDLNDGKWNPGVLEATKVGGHIYGMSAEHRPGYGIFFNKRLLKEAGYAEEELYDLQKNGTWTWSKFEEILKACTRDTDGDGVADTWGMTGHYADYYTVALYSSGADLVSRDPRGLFVNRMASAEVVDALNWANDMWHKYSRPLPEAADAEYVKACFNNGEVAMRISDEDARTELAALEDDWGFVCFPCPDGKEIIVMERPAVMFIPSTYDEMAAIDIAQVYDYYTDPVPGYEEIIYGDYDHWTRFEQYSEFTHYDEYKDSRAVDETLVRMRFGSSKQRLELYIPGLGNAFESDLLQSIAKGERTPSEAIDQEMPALEKMISAQNEILEELYKNMPPTELETEEMTEPETEALTEPETEAPTEPKTETPTEKNTEETKGETIVAPADEIPVAKKTDVWPYVVCGAVIMLVATGLMIKMRH